jgi:diguanylate cyclase (GGDEF)-like protein
MAYHKGWRGAATATAAAMLILVAVEVGLVAVFGSIDQIDWRIFATVSVVLITVSLGIGLMSELQLRDKTSASLLAYTDALTGIPNRRVLDEFMTRYFAAAERGGALAVVMFDVDGFKRYNDRYGHASGDDALRAVSRILEKSTRGMDLTGRYGGEEFVTLMPGSLPSDAKVFAERVRAEIEQCRDFHGKGLTVSAGVAGYVPTMGTAKELLEAADVALYAAKETGKNSVVVSSVGEVFVPADSVS